jgi:hypothetical protein
MTQAGQFMDDTEVKAARRVLRRVQEHLTQTSMAQGAQRDQHGLVDVVHHPANSRPTLNYITPRRSTAWISAKDVAHGLASLRDQARTPRVSYIEGLFPPLFAKTLHDLGLVVEREQTLMVFQAGQDHLPALPTPDGIVFDVVNSAQASAVWWYVWRNAFFDVVTATADPVFIGEDLRQIASGSQIDLVMYRYRFPVGVARVSVMAAEHTAQLSALALMREWRTPELLRSLHSQAVKAALAHDSTLIFCAADGDDDRALCRDNGFVDYGNVVCYAEKAGDPPAVSETTPKDTDHATMEQPVLTSS